jgi:ABC-2 type transport system ATP-binding protein
VNRRWLISLCCALGALVLPASAGARTATVTSFDGTRIHVNFFAAAGLRTGQRAATVMMGPGWGSPGDKNPNDSTSVAAGIPGVGTLRRAGFNVLTWDPRGFGASTGIVHVDNPHFEGRDVSALITWLAHQPQAVLDNRNDPRVGMAGGSYGGGIQLVAAARDHRIDAIVPDIAWHSLVSSLDKHNTGKTGWAGLLYLAGSITGHLDPVIGESYQAQLHGQPLTPAERAFYLASGPGSLVSKIRAPTLLIQGTVDTLFTLQEAVENYALLRRAKTPVQMLWFCGGHGICLTKPGNTGLINRDTIGWLDHYLKGDTATPTGPGFEWVDQNGAEHTAADYPLASAGTLQASGAGTLRLSPTGGAGPVMAPPGAGALGGAAAGITPARATAAVNLTVRAPRSRAFVVGAPRVSITYSGLSTNGQRATSVYGQVVDDATGEVLGNQITPIPIRLDGATRTVSEPLEILAATDRPGEHFTLQLTASTVAYQAQRAVGAVQFSKVKVSLPLVNPHAAPPGLSR